MRTPQEWHESTREQLRAKNEEARALRKRNGNLLVVIERMGAVVVNLQEERKELREELKEHLDMEAAYKLIRELRAENDELRHG